MLPLRIAIDATPLGSGRGGDETYLRNLIAALARTADPEDRFTLYVRPGVAMPDGADEPLFTRRSLRLRTRWARYLVELPLALRRERPRPDLLLVTTHAPPISSTAYALILHDLSFLHHPEFYPPATRWRLNLLVPMHARRARAVVTVSEFSRADIVANYRIPEDRVLIVPNAVVPPGPRGTDRASGSGAPDGPYFLYLGNLHARKNVVRLIAAFGRARELAPEVADHRLVIAGAAWWGGDEERRAAQALPAGAVIFLGAVSDHERETLLRGAVALAYPSLFEGFGLPPLEAMAAGVPVVASNTSAMLEVLQDAALLVPPHDADAIADALVAVATDRELRRRLRECGRQRAARYDLDRMGRQALAAFRKAVAPVPSVATET